MYNRKGQFKVQFILKLKVKVKYNLDGLNSCKSGYLRDKTYKDKLNNTAMISYSLCRSKLLVEKFGHY